MTATPSVSLLDSGSAAAQPGWGQAAFVLLFAFVGWESVLRARTRSAAAAAGGVAVVAFVYLGAAFLAWGDRSAAFDHPAGRVLCGLAGAVCAVACVRNVGAVADVVHRDVPRRIAVPVCGGIAGAGVWLVHTGRLGLTDVLAVPNAMALAVFLTAACSCAVLTNGWHRGCAVVAGAAYLVLVPFAGVALVFPLGVLLVCVLKYGLRSAPCP